MLLNVLTCSRTSENFDFFPKISTHKILTKVFEACKKVEDAENREMFCYE